MNRNVNGIFSTRDLPSLLQRRLAGSPLPVRQDPYPGDFFDAPAQPAAVLMPLIFREGGWHLIFIRRAENSSDRHSGQVAFPGGRVDDIDRDDEAAALREADEEIGLKPDRVELLGRLGAYRTISNYRVTPVVGRVQESFSPAPDPREVEYVFTIPLEWLADPANIERRKRPLPGTDTCMDVLYYRHYDGELLWGITARLVSALVSGFNTIG